MKHYYFLVAALMLVFLASFGLVEALEVPLLTDPTPWMSDHLWQAACIGVALLALDIFLPVPATIVMITHGALFGVLLGTLFSLIGSQLAGWLGFYVGRRGDAFLERWIPAAERARADALLQQWGVLAVILSRPVPILSESVAIMAGTSSIGWLPFSLATLAGAVPAAFLYAYTGATAISFDSMVTIFGLVLLIAGFVWFVGRTFKPRNTPANEAA